MNYHNVNQHHQQHQRGIIEPSSAYRSYQQLPSYGGNAAVQQQRHHDAQGSMVLAVSGAGENQAQMIHRPVYTQQQPLPMPTTKEMDPSPAVPQQKPQKKRPRNNPNPSPTATETETEPPTAPIVDRVPSGKERRRTQMRIAQRAYRQRKQNELSSRAKQLSERDDVIARMKTAFDALRARLVEADVLSVCPGLKAPMVEMERGFEALGQMASDSGSGSGAAASVPGVGGGQGQVDVPVLETGVVDPNQQRQWTSPDFGSDSSDPFDPLNHRGYPVYGTTVPTQAFDMHRQYPNTYQQYTSRTIPITTMNELSLPAPAYIPPPTSYSFQETTFARRLMRICVERAHEVLISGGLPTLSPKEARVFKLAYRIWSRDYLVQKFQMALTGTSDLYDPSVPFVPLGGAGMHYVHLGESPPLVSQSMSSSSSSNYTHHHHHQQPHIPSGQIVTSGPLTTHTAHIRHDGPDTSLTGIASSLGLLDDGSEWFDVQDIDGYLQDMGIRLEPHSTIYRFSVPANPGIASRRTTVMGLNPLAGVVNQVTGGGGAGGGDVMGQEYVPAYVDVERFINSLVTKAMCLGRAPGFRKRDVEEQFYNSIEVLPS